MWLNFLIPGLLANLYCSTSPCTSCSQKYLYKSTSCLDLCPSGYMLDISSSKCEDSGSKLLFALDFLDFSVFKASSIENFSNQQFSFDDTLRRTPLPTLQTGFYFVSTSYLESSTSWVPAPDFSVYFIAKFTPTSGQVFRILKNSIEIFSIKLDSNLQVKWLLTSLNKEYDFNISIPVTFNTWVNIELASVQSTDLLTIKIKQVLSSNITIISVINTEFRSQYSELKFIIGDQSSSFKGMISWLSAENLEKSSYSKFNPFYLRSEGQAMFSGTSCTNTTCTWPWCVISSNCKLYASSHCNTGTGYLPKDCTSCSSGTPPYCGRRFGCNVGDAFNCSTCSVNYTNVDGYCLRNPTFFNQSDLKNPVFDSKFDEIVKNYGGVFQSGQNESTYAPFNNPEKDDPWPAKSRGLYFNGSQFLTVKNGFNFNYKFTISIWSRSESLKSFLECPTITLRGDYFFRVLLRSTNFHYYAYNRNILTDYLNWVFFHVVLSQTGVTSTLKWFFNSQLSDTVSVDGFTYTGTNEVLGYLDVGRWRGDTLYWIGFIYRVTIWQSSIEDVSSFSNICGSTFSNTCLWNCSISEYFDSIFKKCLTCESPCSNCSTFGTCNLCSDIRCTSCSSLSSSCEALSSDPCLPGFYLSPEFQCCKEPCLTCYFSSSNYCLSCKAGYFLYGQICIFNCPLGYIAEKSDCVLKTNPCINLSFDTILNFEDSANQLLFSAGIISKFYPSIDSFSPLPAEKRGYYFSSQTFLLSSEFTFGCNLTFEFWIKVQSFGIVFSKNIFEFSAGISTDISITGVFDMISKDFPLNVWTQVLFSMKTNVIREFLGFLLINDYSDQLSLTEGYFNDSSSVLSIGKSGNSFSGFLWSFKVYNDFRNSFISSFKICSSSLEVDCTWDCNITQFLKKSDCVDCHPDCLKGCRRLEDCNLCEDRACSNCTSFNGGCKECDDGWKISKSACSCVSGFFLRRCNVSCTENSNSDAGMCECTEGQIEKLMCLPCHKSCESCNGSSFNECLTCPGNTVLKNDSRCDCSPGYFLESLGRCKKCESLCMSCSSDNSCSRCKNSSILTSDGICICDQGYLKVDDACVRKKFTAIIKVLDANKINLLFTEKLAKELNEKDFNIIKNSTILKFSITSITVSNYIIETESINNKNFSSIYFLMFNKEIVSEKSSLLFPSNYTFKIKNIETNDPISQEIKEITSQAKSVLYIGLASSVGLSLISANPGDIFNFLNAAEIFSFVILFNYNFDPILVAFLSALRPSSFIRGWFKKVIPETSGQKLDKKYKDFGMEMNLLLVNAGVYYVFLGAYLILSLILFGISFMKNRVAVKLTQSLKSFLMFKAFLRLWIQSCLEVTIAALLGVSESKLIDFYSYFDFFLCIFTFALNAVGVWILIKSIYSLKKINISEELENHKKKYSTFFDEFKCKETSDVLFYIIFVFRRLSLCILVYFIESFVFQLSIAFCFSFAVNFIQVALYTIIVQPFKETLEGWCKLCLELITCIFYLVILVPSLFSIKIENNIKGLICIRLVTVAIYCNASFSILKLLLKICLFIKRRYLKRKLSIVPLDISVKTPITKINNNS